MTKKVLFLLLPLLVSCSGGSSSVQPSSEDERKNIQDDVVLEYGYNTFKDFQNAYEIFKKTNSSFPALVPDFDKRSGYDTKYTIQGVGSIESKKKLENTRLLMPKLIFTYTYDGFTTEESEKDAISLEFSYASPMTEINGYDSSLLNFTSEHEEIKVYYSGIFLLSGSIRYDASKVNIDTVSDFKESLKQDMKYIA